MEFWDPGQWLAVGIVLVVFLVAAYIYFRTGIGRCHSSADLTGKTAIVTGANSGIGYYTALDLAKRNARVILACRDQKKAEAARQKIVAETGNTNVAVGSLDLCYMRSVRAFVKDILEHEPRLDILVNNAGIVSAGKPREVTDEKLETLFAANYFGPFLLTNLLLDLMKKSAPSRIVNVSSVVNKYGSIDFSNLQAEKSFNYRRRYFDSKLALILFTRELARQLEGQGVTANVLHPGSVSTDLLRNMFFPLRLIVTNLINIFCKTPEEGAQTSIHLAVSEEVKEVSGKYFVDCEVKEHEANPVSRDMGLAAKLWEASEHLTGLTVADQSQPS